jgi:iron(III) transport system ATP-binding protein
LWKSFGGEAVVRDVSFTVSPGRILALLGPSGCGKTTTLRLIAGFESLDRGSIEIAGQLVAGAGANVPPERRQAGMVFQDYAIFPHLNVAANVGFALGRSPNAQQRVEELLAFVGLAGLGKRPPQELSGGQQQRVALARALAAEPAVLLLDEPFSNLDAAMRKEVRLEVKSLLKQSGSTAVFVTHDQEEALFLGDDVAVMNEGRLEQTGTASEIFHSPRTRFVAQFMGQTDFLPGTAMPGGVETPLGLLARPLPVAEGTILEVAVRPDDVRLQPDPRGNGRVISRQFLGIAFLYQIRLSHGAVVHSWQSHQIDLAIGDPVRADLRPGHTLNCFYEGLAI